MRVVLTLLCILKVLHVQVKFSILDVSAFAFASTTCCKSTGRCSRIMNANHHDDENNDEKQIKYSSEFNLNQNNKTNDDKNRMLMVRSLQNLFYDDNEKVSWNVDSGEIRNLPLWRVNWWELPGRTNVLSVHEGVYTHMFEGMIRRCQRSDSEKIMSSMYFGHLYTPSSSSHSHHKNIPLCSYQEILNDGDNDDSTAAVIGTLMRIVDYRRRDDGKLLLLVQGLDRFVVTKAIQSTPYGVANVRILPDSEEIINNSSFQWMDYENDSSVRFPFTKDREREISVKDVYGPSLAALMPYTPMASNLVVEDDALCTKSDRSEEHRSFQLSLESDLLSKKVVHRISSHPEATCTYACTEDLSSQELEYRIWVKLDEFQQLSGKTLSPELLALLPSDDIIIERSTSVSSLCHNNKSTFNYSRNMSSQLMTQAAAAEYNSSNRLLSISKAYPSHRRWMRLSYTAPGVLERIETRQDLRNQLLTFVSTRDRLRFVYEQLGIANNAIAMSKQAPSELEFM